MAKIKFNPEVNPLNKEHYGYTFQRNRYGFSMFPASKSGRKRYLLQFEKMQYMQKAIRNWRDMSSTSKTAWNDFAATYPVPTEKDPGIFLSGYQLFLKRHFYRFLHEGINFEFMEFPIMEALPVPDFSIEIKDGGWCADLTEEYIRNFGLLPVPGQFIICRILPMAVNSGQFFEPLIATLEVQEIYMDGLICSFVFSPIPEDIVFSIYVSKPVWESVQYPGTKFRYMGCFKPTTFLQLTDTPASYENEAGKVVSVKDDETGLEFTDPAGCEVCPPVPSPADAGKVIIVNPAGDGYELGEGGGGGLSCEDLLNCPTIQAIFHHLDTSLPTIHLGYLYNFFVSMGTGEKSLFSDDNWKVPNRADMQTLGNAIGCAGDFLNNTAAPGVKDSNEIYWQPQTLNTNQYRFNARPPGFRDYRGVFLYYGKQLYIMGTSFVNDNPLLSYYPIYLSLTDAFVVHESFMQGKEAGVSIRGLRITTTLNHLESGIYVGNDGRIYRTICIYGQEWLADNLAETKLRDGTEIPLITDATDWRYIGASARCAPNNDINLV